MRAPPDDRPAPPESLLALQRRFAGHIRDPDRVPAPDGIEDRRMAIYRRLFFNNLSNLFAKNFPVARELLGAQAWQELIRAFMIEHRPSTPLFPEIGREFVRFLVDQPLRHRDWPWLAELAAWEFLKTAVRNAEDDPASMSPEAGSDLVEEVPILNPTVRIGRFDWPVHEFTADHLPDGPCQSPLLLLVYRRRNESLGMMRINAMTARLLELMQEFPEAAGRVHIERLARESDHPDSAALLDHARSLLDNLRSREVLLGSRPLPA